MANEATMEIEYSPPINFSVLNATGIEKGTVMKLSGQMYAVASDAHNDLIAGILAKEKIASDGKTTASVYRDGVFKVTLSGAASYGDALVSAGYQNKVRLLKQESLSGHRVIGTAMESGADAETILMELKPQNIVADI